MPPTGIVSRSVCFESMVGKVLTDELGIVAGCAYGVDHRLVTNESVVISDAGRTHATSFICNP